MTYVGMSAKVEIAFVANPYSSALVWTDVTSRVAKLKTTTGRNYETGKNESSSVNVELRNNDGALNPMNTASPYYPYVLPFRPIRITASTITTTTTTGGGPAYPGALYPGGTSPGATTATSPTATTTTGPSYPIWYGYVSSWPQSVKDQTSQYEMVNVVGVDAFKAVLGFVPGDPYDVKVRKDYGAYTAPGLSSTAWNFFPFDEAASPFAGENGGAAGSAGTVTKSSPSPCRTAIVLTGTGAVAAVAPASFAYPQGELWFNPTALPTSEGQFFCVYAVSGNGTPTPSVMELTTTGYNAQAMQMIGLFKPYANRMTTDDASTFNTGTGTWTATNATLARSTAVSVDGSSLQVTPTAGAATFSTTAPLISVTAGWNYLLSAQMKITLATPSTGFQNSGAISLSGNWLNSSGGVISTFSGGFTSSTSFVLSGGTAMAPTGAVSLQVAIGPINNGPFYAGDLAYVDVIQVFTDSGRGATYVPPLSSVYRLPSVGSTVALVAQLPTTATSSSPAAAGAHLASITPPALNQWHHVAFVPQTVAGTGLLVLDGVAQPLTLNAAVTTSSTQASSPTLGAASTVSGVVYFGFSGALAGYYQAGTATGLNNISQTYAAQHYNYGTTATGAARTHDFPSEVTSARVTDVLMAIGFPTAMTSLETGLTTMTASGNVSGVTATSLLVAAAEAELGNVFVDRNGVVTFHNRYHRNSPTSVIMLGDGYLPSRFNLCANPNFETDLTGWATIGTPGSTVTRDTVVYKSGVASLKATALGPSTFLSGTAYTFNTISGHTYTVTGQVFIPTTGGVSSVSVLVGGFGLGTSVSATGSWQPSTITFTANASVHLLNFAYGTATAGQAYYVDEVIIEEAATSNGGYFDGSTTAITGTAYTWQGTPNESVSKATATMITPGVPYEGNIVIGFDDTNIFNDIQVTQGGGPAPAYVFEAQDPTSQNVYGVRTKQQTIQAVAQSDVQGMAATLLARYKDPRPRLATLSIELRSKPNYIPNVFGLRIGDLVTINHRPPGGTMFSFQCFIDGISHTVDQTQWMVTLNTTPYYPSTTY